ncbi:MAG: 3-isopropylmalate dehydratase large subunit [Myxococcaceae bacterium]
MSVSVGKSLYEKIWDAHVVERMSDGTCLLIVDRQLIYETTSPPAFQGLRAAGRKVRRPRSTLAVADHSVPTRDRENTAGWGGKLVDELRANCETSGIPYLDIGDPRHGIVHIVGPEQGFTLPGLLMACSDSHTSTHGALGALAFGIGVSELEQILATQTLQQKPSKTMRITLDGVLQDRVVGKDLVLAILGRIGVAGGVGYAIEFAGEGVNKLPMAGRFTLCNMTVEAGARCGLIAPDDVVFGWLKGRPMAPKGELWEQAVAYWHTLRSDIGAGFDREMRLDVSKLAPQVTWGTSPDEVTDVDGWVPDPDQAPTPQQSDKWRRSLSYMGLKPGTAIKDIRIDRVFIGSCTNSRLEDLRAAAGVVAGRRLAASVHGMVVPGSGLTKQAAEAEGLDRIFRDAGFEWRDAGCSMCFGTSNDSLSAGQRCASTSNRNFENRQGSGGRTHLVSPAMAAAAGIAGHFVDIRELPGA